MNLVSAIRGLVVVVAATATVATALPRDHFPQSSSGPASRPFAARLLPRGESRGEITPQERQEIMEFLRQNMPELAKQLETLRKSNPQLAERHFRQAAALYRHVKDYPPEVREAALAKQRLNVSILRTVRQLRSAKPEDRPRLQEQLKSLLGEQFDKEMVVREYELQRLTSQLATLKEDIEQRKANREKVIQNQLQRVQQWSTASRPAQEAEPERGGI